MFADNDVISARQLLCQVTLGMLGVFLLVLPGSGELYGIKGVICCLLGFLLVAVYCFFWCAQRRPTGIRRSLSEYGAHGCWGFGLFLILFLRELFL